MAIPALTITFLFVGLGLTASALVALHDGVDAWLQRRSLRPLRDGGGGVLPQPQGAYRRPTRRPRPASRELLFKRPGLGGAPIDEPDAPAWLQNARRDVGHR